MALRCVCALMLLCTTLAMHVPYQSRCIGWDLDGLCPVLPLGTIDRYQDKPEATIPIVFHGTCGIDLKGPIHSLLIQDISHHGKGLTAPLVPTPVLGAVLYVGAPEPGTQLFNLTLVHAASQAIVDYFIVCLEMIPSPRWEAPLQAASDPFQHPEAGYAPHTEVSAHMRALAEGKYRSVATTDELVRLEELAWSRIPSTVRPINILWVRTSVIVSHLTVCYCYSATLNTLINAHRESIKTCVFIFRLVTEDGLMA